MRIVFSRKDFDSGRRSGGAASPIINASPISLPIPANKESPPTYESAGLGDLVERATNGRVRRGDYCHEDPMFHAGRWAFGQVDAAQSHLRNQGVGIGDVFLFFGYFVDEQGDDPHHRIFGYMLIEEVRTLGCSPTLKDQPTGFPRRHPHTLGRWSSNNTVYIGSGARARTVHPKLRLSKQGKSRSVWARPSWMNPGTLSYHSKHWRWSIPDELQVVSRGQEFVANLGSDQPSREWLAEITSTIECGGDSVPAAQTR